MKTEKINRLIQALGKNSPSNNNLRARPRAYAESTPVKVALPSTDAVQVQISSNARAQKLEATESTERSDKVKRIKEQVANGTYQAESSDIATSFVKELY